jgi:hypothetical protein
VAALVLLRCFVGVVHRCPSPRGTFLCKVFGRKDLSLDFRWLAAGSSRWFFLPLLGG